MKNFAAILTLSALLAPAGLVHAQTDAATVAEAAPTEALPGIPLSVDLMFRYLSAELAHQRGQAFAAYSTMLSIAQAAGDPRLARRAAEIAIAGSLPTQALKAAKLWQELAPRSEEAAQVLVSLQLVHGRQEDAKQALAQQLAASPPAQLPQAIATVQRMLSRIPDKAKAMALMRELLEPYRESLDARLALAQFAMVSGDRAAAQREVREAVTKFPKSELAVLVLAQIIDNKQEAAKVLAEFLQRNPKARDVRLAYARMLFEQSKMTEAKKEFKTLIQQMPNDQTALYALGLMSVQAGDLTDAETYLSGYIRSLNGQPDRERDATQPLMVLTQLAEDRGDLKAALTWLDMVDTLGQPGQLGTTIKRAQLQAKDGKVDEALQMLAAADVESDDDRVRLILSESQLLRDAGRIPDAVKLLAEALESLPNNVDLLYEYSLVTEKNEQFDEMERVLRRIIQIAPDNHHAYNALGYSFADRNIRLQEAYDLIKVASTLAPDDPYIMDSLGWVEFRLGRLEKAEEILRRAYGIKQDAEIAVHLGEVLWMRGREEEAKKFWRNASGKDPKNETLKGTLQRLRVKL